MHNDHLARLLEAGVAQLELGLSVTQIQQLLDYVNLLHRWNRAYNLTAVRDIEEMVSRHLLDSLSVLSYQGCEPLLDVGTGPGLPGIPLAICQPERAITLLDSNGKKTRFLRQAQLELGLKNIHVIQSRVEDYQPTTRFPFVISRAFASLADMVNWCDHLLADEGVMLAMKGLYPEDELSALPKGYIVRESFSLTVPGTVGERHLLMLGRTPR